MSTETPPPTPLKKIDLTQSVAGEEDPGASIDLTRITPVPPRPSPGTERPQDPKAPA
ncbi:MAG: hypothetical protein V4669_18285 [Pseudomonadota bacterium]